MGNFGITPMRSPGTTRAQNRVRPIWGNGRLSLFLPELQDDLRNRPPPHSTTG
jgi:hypothetical protein